MKTNRRDFIKTITTGSVALSFGNTVYSKNLLTGNFKNPSPSNIKKVYVTFKTHLDIGYTSSARKITKNLIDWKLPTVIRTSKELAKRGFKHKLVDTYGAWVINEALDQKKGISLKELEEAISAGTITWSAMPFSLHSEYFDHSLYEFILSISKKLDVRFGKTTIAGKVTDVPCHTINIVPLLAEAGVKFLHIGSNGACVNPEVPDTFIWRHKDGSEIIVMYCGNGYGSDQCVDGFDEALGLVMKGDNMDPWTMPEVIYAFDELQKKYVNAEIVGAPMDAFAEKLISVKNKLPIITQELGDTWVFGTASDPLLTSQFRELSRLRKYWIIENKVDKQDAGFEQFSNRLALVGEHTWGLDMDVYLNDQENFENLKFNNTRSHSNFRFMEESWKEKREYIEKAVLSLKNPDLIKMANTALKNLVPQQPELGSFSRTSMTDFETPHFIFSIDNQGSINKLIDKTIHKDWASNKNIGLFRYQTFDSTDYEKYNQAYWKTNPPPVSDAPKTGLAATYATSNMWNPQIKYIYSSNLTSGFEILIELILSSELTLKYGCPQKIYSRIFFPNDKPEIHFELSWFDKPASRMPEAIWFSFIPDVTDNNGWSFEKLGGLISPVNVISNGSRNIHSIDKTINYSSSDGKLNIETLDANIVSPGIPSILNFHNQIPDMKNGIHFNLCNNLWVTNFTAWYEENARFRFILSFLK